MNHLAAALRSGTPLLMDGAMATEVQRLSQAPEYEGVEHFNLTEPDLIRSIHRSYRDAGADVLLTNTFQANPTALASRQLRGRQREIWQAGVRLARAESPRFVLADVGPIEGLSVDVARELLADSVGVDGLLLETWTSVAALELFANANRGGVPLLVSFTFLRRDAKLMTIEGVSPEECARAAERVGAMAIGANCGREIGTADMKEIVERFQSTCDLPTLVRPNAGTPWKDKGQWKYPLDGATLATEVKGLVEVGVAMIGGCCGTTPEHIRAIGKMMLTALNR